MPLELLLSEARGMSDDSLMEVVRFMRFIKFDSRSAAAPDSDTKIVRQAGKYRGRIVMSDDFDEPLEEFKEYM